MSDPGDPEQESRRLALLLSRLLKLEGRSVRSVEQQLGIGSSGLGKVLNGNIRLQVSHIMMVIEVLGMTPAQFFHLAYPKKPPQHRLAKELRGTQGLSPEEESNLESPELEARVRRILLRMLSDALRSEGLDPQSEEPA